MARRNDPRKKDLILKSARQLFKERGVEKTTIAEIARHSGIATGTVYVYFDSKGKIIDALCDFYLMDNLRAVTESYKEPDLRKAAAAAIHAALKHASENADLVRLIDIRRSVWGKANRPEADRELQKATRDRLSKYVAEGYIKSYNVKILAELITGLLEWISKVCFVWSDVDPSRYEATLVQLLNDALTANYKEEKP